MSTDSIPLLPLSQRLPECIQKLDLSVYRLSREQLIPIIKYIHRRNWECEPSPSRWKKKQTGLAAGFIYLGDEKFCINLNTKVGEGGFKKVKYGLLYYVSARSARIVANACFHYKDYQGVAQHEKKLAKKFKHDFVKTYHVVDVDLKLSIISQLYDSDGEDAKAFLSTLDKIHVLIQVAKDLHFFHQRGYAHGDIKSSNFLVKWGENKAHLIDFGLAIKISQFARYIGEKRGTYQYWAPEILEYALLNKGDPAAIKALPTEVFSFGKVIAELLDLPLFDPWEGISSEGVTEHIRNKESLKDAALQELYKRCTLPVIYTGNDPLYALAVEMLQVDPLKRPTMENVIERLERARETAAAPALSGQDTLIFRDF